MRPLIKTCACFALIIAAATPAQSQILSSLRKKAADALEKKTEQQVDQRIDAMTQKLVDNSFNAAFGDPGSVGGSGTPFAIGTNVKTEDRYTFSVVTTMEMESVKKSGKSDGKAVMMMHFNPDEQYTGTRIINAEVKKSDGDAFIVFDLKNKAMVMLMSTDTSKVSVAFGWKDVPTRAPESTAGARTEQVNWDTVSAWKNFRKIGTRTIAGYAADGYRTESEKATVETWVTHDRSLGFGNMFAANSNMKQMKGKLPDDYPDGMLLEMNSVDKNSGDRVTMKVTDINRHANVTYVMADYRKTDMKKK